MWQIFLVLLCCWGDARRNSLRVKSGRGDIKNDFLFAVSLQTFEGLRFCTGSLIARDWVLTAGHCISPDKFVIRYHNLNITEGAGASVIKVFRHPGYVDLFDKGLEIIHNDVAIVKVTEIPGKTIGKLSALDYKTLLGLPVKYAAFGEMGEEPTERLDGHQYRSLEVGEAVVRQRDHDGQGPCIQIAPKCSNRKQGILGGDSGGPLIYDGKIIGVAMSFSTTDNIANYAPVSLYVDWIHSKMIMYGYNLS